MLTRIQIDGFKNLDRVDVRFGPLTCIAGANGVGKSNLFDAIRFLSSLAEHSLLQASRTVRGGDGNRGDARNLFRRQGDTVADRMTLAVEFLAPPKGEDWLRRSSGTSSSSVTAPTSTPPRRTCCTWSGRA